MGYAAAVSYKLVKPLRDSDHVPVYLIGEFRAKIEIHIKSTRYINSILWFTGYGKCATIFSNCSIFCKVI